MSEFCKNFKIDNNHCVCKLENARKDGAYAGNAYSTILGQFFICTAADIVTDSTRYVMAKTNQEAYAMVKKSQQEECKKFE